MQLNRVLSRAGEHLSGASQGKRAEQAERTSSPESAVTAAAKTISWAVLRSTARSAHRCLRAPNPEPIRRPNCRSRVAEVGNRLAHACQGRAGHFGGEEHRQPVDQRVDPVRSERLSVQRIGWRALKTHIPECPRRVDRRDGTVAPCRRRADAEHPSHGIAVESGDDDERFSSGDARQAVLLRHGPADVGRAAAPAGPACGSSPGRAPGPAPG